MRCFLGLAANAILSALAGFGVAEVAAAFGHALPFYVAAGVIGGCFAAAAACLTAGETDGMAGLPKVVGLVGTLAVCAAALLGHLSPPTLKTAAVVFWFVGLGTQALGLAMALSARRADNASKRLHRPDHQKPRGA